MSGTKKGRKKTINGYSGADESSAHNHNPIIPLHYIISAMDEDKPPKDDKYTFGVWDLWRTMHLGFTFPMK